MLYNWLYYGGMIVKEVQLFFRKICVYLGLYFLFMYQDCCMYRVLDVTISHSWLINPPRFIWKREYDFWEICFIFKFLKLLEIYKQILVSFNTNVFGKLSLLSKLITNFWFTFCQFIEQVWRMQFRCRYTSIFVWHVWIAAYDSIVRVGEIRVTWT